MSEKIIERIDKLNDNLERKKEEHNSELREMGLHFTQ